MSDCARCGKPLSPDVRLCPDCGKEAPALAAGPLTGDIGMVKVGQDVHIGDISVIHPKATGRPIRSIARVAAAGRACAWITSTNDTISGTWARPIAAGSNLSAGTSLSGPLPPVPLILSL